MALSVARYESALELQLDGPLIRLRYSRNRYHYHPRVYRLHLEQLGECQPEDLGIGLGMLLRELLQVTAQARPLLFRSTVSKDSPLLAVLRSMGFLETRRVYEPWLYPADVPETPLVPPTGTALTPLSSALDRNLHRELVELYVEIYARTSRLDPATPEQLSAEDWTDELLADPDLDKDLSCCVFRGDRPVGLATVYRGEQEDTIELGPFGVTKSELGMH